MELFLNDKLGKINLVVDNATDPKAALIIAHGAGAGMDHPFMKELAYEISIRGVTTIRFNFPYMEQGRKSPGSPKSNIETWKLVTEYLQNEMKGLPIFVSGKSYGGRMASHLLADNEVDGILGIIYFGFPLHAPGKDSKERAAHLVNIKIPQLFLQGSKDKLANPDMMKEVTDVLEKQELHVIQEADHSFNVPKKSGKTNVEIVNFLAIKSTEWIDDIISN